MNSPFFIIVSQVCFFKIKPKISINKVLKIKIRFKEQSILKCRVYIIWPICSFLILASKKYKLCLRNIAKITQNSKVVTYKSNKNVN